MEDYRVNLRPGVLNRGKVRLTSAKSPKSRMFFSGAVTEAWIFVMTLCFSRHTYAEIVPNQKTATWPLSPPGL